MAHDVEGGGVPVLVDLVEELLHCARARPQPPHRARGDVPEVDHFTKHTTPERAAELPAELRADGRPDGALPTDAGAVSFSAGWSLLGHASGSGVSLWDTRAPAERPVALVPAAAGGGGGLCRAGDDAAGGVGGACCGSGSATRRPGFSPSKIFNRSNRLEGICSIASAFCGDQRAIASGT